MLPSDTRLWDACFAAAEAFAPLDDRDLDAMIGREAATPPLYVESMQLALPVR